MAYATYTTEALVCGTFNRNTADRSYRLFTRKAGMLYATARSVRNEKSRQRYALQDFSLIRVSLVRGKSGWRIGSVEAHTNYYATATTKEARGSVVSTIKLLSRFLNGEEADARLFDYAIESLAVLASEIDNRAFVTLVVHVQILALLGYVASQAIPQQLREADFAQYPILYSLQHEKALQSLLEKAQSASQL